MPSRAAATVPEYVMSSPRFEPWLMPETISSGWNSISPSVANRTQSTGVPSVAKPDVPSPNSTSSTQSGRRVVIERAVALRFESGAITASSMPGSSSRARRRAWSPVAWMPSSLVKRTFKAWCSRVVRGIFRVRRGHMSKTRFLLVAVVAALAIPTSTATALTLSDPAALPKSLPGDGQMQGGEPSLAFDPTGDGHLYSVAPGGSDKGVNFWASPDRGNTWQYVRTIGSSAGGGDADVEVGIEHKVYAIDLELASSAVCRSTDFGKTFGDGCEEGAAQDQAGAEEDRQWITHDPNDANTTYFNYHDLSLQYPIIEKSTDGGSSYVPCGNLVDPSNPLFPSAIGNTIVGKSAVAKDGNIYVPIGAPTMMQVAQSGASGGVADYGQIVVAHHKGCNGDQFDNTTVYANDGGSFSNLFISNAVGPDNTLFVIASGRLDATGPYNTYLFVSRDQGKTFSKPITVNSGDLKTNVMSAVAAGKKPGQVVIGWYGRLNSATPTEPKAECCYYVARSEDYGA